MRPDMLFRLGSTTKMFTAAALVGLALEGKLDLNAPISKYVMGLPPRLSEITANQLLSHTAGIRDEAPMYGSHDDSALATGIHTGRTTGFSPSRARSIRIPTRVTGWRDIWWSC